MDAGQHLNPGIGISPNAFEQPQDDSFSLDAWASNKSGTDSNEHLEHSRSNPNMHSNDASPTYTESKEQPPWADMKTKAGKDRKRLPLACIACRRKKIKCSGEKPSCQHCSKSRIPCVYKQTQRRATPRTDYMGMLDKRLKRMEERVIKIVPKGEAENVPRAVLKPTAAAAQGKGGANKKRVVDEAFGHDLDGWAADESSKSEPYQYANTSSADDRKTMEEGKESLPPKDIQRHLAEVYFDYIYGQSYFLLHKGRYMVDLENDTVPPYLNLAVCAVSARFSNHPDLQTEPAFLRGEQWSRPAQDIALSVFDTPNINTLMVLVLLCLHGFGCCQGGRAWMLSGMAHRMSYALRLHKDPRFDGLGAETGSELSFIDREIRRRAMWACFCLDRFTSSGTERPMFAGERYMQLSLPVREKMFRDEIPGPTEELNPSESPLVAKIEGGLPNNPKENMGIAAYVTRVIALWGRINDYMNHGGRIMHEMYALWSPKSGWKSLQDQLDEFIRTLPSRLQYSQENLQVYAAENCANAFLLLHVAYNQSIIFLNRYAFPNIAVYEPCKGEPEQFVDQGRHRALVAASRISDMIAEATKYRMVFPFGGYAAYVSSAVQLYGAFSGDENVAKASKDRLSCNIRYLLKMKRHWGMLHFLTENLKELYQIHAKASKDGQPLKPDSSDDRRAVFQYADWHERFPRGVSTKDLEPVQAPRKLKDLGSRKPTDLQSVEEYFAANPKTRDQQHKSSSNPHKSARKEAHRANVGTPRSAPGIAVATTQATLSDRTRSPRSVEMQEASPASFGMPDGYERYPQGHIPHSTPTSAFPGELPNVMATPQTPLNHMAHHAFPPNDIPPDMPPQGFVPEMMNVDYMGHPPGYGDEFLSPHPATTHQWNTNFSLNMALPPGESPNFFGIPTTGTQLPWMHHYDGSQQGEPPDTKSNHG